MRMRLTLATLATLLGQCGAKEEPCAIQKHALVPVADREGFADLGGVKPLLYPQHDHGALRGWKGVDGVDVLKNRNRGLLRNLPGGCRPDELHQVKPDIAGNIVYMAANGSGKHRRALSFAVSSLCQSIQIGGDTCKKRGIRARRNKVVAFVRIGLQRAYLINRG